MKKDFIYETSRTGKIKNLIIGILFIFILVQLSFIFEEFVYEHVKNSRFIEFFGEFVKNDLLGLTPTGLFYFAFIGTSIFVPMPMEFIFYYGLIKGSNVLVSFILVIVGIFLAQLVNYWIGLKFSPLFLRIIPTKKLYKARRFINRYGGHGILLFNLAPLPAEILTFGLGLTKYNGTRLFVLTLIGNLIKYAAIVGIYFLFK